VQAVLAHPDRDRGQLGELVALRGRRLDALVLREDMRAGPAALRPVLYDLIDARERQPRPALALVPGLAAGRTPARRLLRARRRRGRILRGRKRRGTRTPGQPLLELGDAGLEPPVRLDQLPDLHQQRDRGFPLAVEDRLRLGTLHTEPVRRPQRGPCLQK